MPTINSYLFRVALISAVLALASCGGGGSGSNTPPIDSPPSASNIAQDYLDEIISLMRENAVTRDTVDWGNLESEVKEIAVNATSIRQTYPAITRALELAGANHSFLNSPSGDLITYPSDIRCEQDIVLDRPDVSGIGYVRVDAVTTNSTVQAVQTATNIQSTIASQDSAEVTGWIVDLRNNFGGNMWPMIAGLGPLFDNNLLGHFIDPDENAEPWGYEDGTSFIGTSPVVTVNMPYTLINPLPKIAVLTSARTASSGEATMIAFKKQFNVRFFGTDSCGLSTANTNYQLSDGSVLFLTTAVTADREREKYGERVAVDQPTAPEETLAQAVEWLQN